MQDLSDIGTNKQILQEKRSSQVEWTPRKVKKNPVALLTGGSERSA